MTELLLKVQKREKLADQLYGQILEQIVSGNLGEGTKLPSENEICASFGVSRPVVREALRKLQSDGLVYARQGVGSFVKKRPPQGLIEFGGVNDVAGLLRCFEARIAIEGATARMAAERASVRHHREIENALKTLEDGVAAGDIADKADLDFHMAIARASGNEIFLTILNSLHGVMQKSMNVALNITRSGSADRAKRVLAEHRQIYDAILGRDGDSAELMMRYHLHQARQRVTDHARDM
ncbi:MULTISPECIES: FadR/GntR family transcriptional regulator [Thalassospira]|jgi:DNA-binding FadR family transcriptional regulator|uniref:FadR family transcriptional regulator n=1 Tax=Thalassospira povalilytica TaxID=732237 RepID=A0A8I1M977_9PROT|nr:MULTISPECIES: FadR/GntR family transcriptional regulator [Thalassospira]MEE3045015.1 FadR/GntR family transcriptional regulator [Pseudomonadota bacterium]RCK19499.1 GntR family transcriptional regulator [Thalassospira profundimaris]KZB66004.1 GntR family transcriptional regulator [Thalassospira sp. MCCC 1A02491]MAL41667.1 FadR family transcriptional regulator [Thalassospira sp.]MBN8197713.1 FadR family transcriptional regulator [Thalassospira povalilytica]|tara:strand:+ start:384 stop:1100 length:717 start_codon:yes stop_codon:yes gene_type:complete|eukprot:NODE_498_length_1867_cov_1.635632_g490_i0.p2 GENE.NODE_498_length_1867_cov_1.635632_g490_i0~~NODE_498_length_1867_cov_1.635632_g490_i0.p2  ORF type:complete len:239 (+),score=26.79 NODE_498_length_1867_cov_1.635632_g490_i0:873-1589(+)